MDAWIVYAAYVSEEKNVVGRERYVVTIVGGDDDFCCVFARLNASFVWDYYQQRAFRWRRRHCPLVASVWIATELTAKS